MTSRTGAMGDLSSSHQELWGSRLPCSGPARGAERSSNVESSVPCSVVVAVGSVVARTKACGLP